VQACSVEDGTGPAQPAAESQTSARCAIVAAGGSVALLFSTFSSLPSAPTDELALLSVTSANVEVLIRGSAVRHLALRSVGCVAIVNTSFVPPLNASALQTLQPDANMHCGATVAGETVCDPQARCDAARSGGVECACAGNGLFVKSGTRPDGHECEQFRCNKGRYIADNSFGGGEGSRDGRAEALSCAACSAGYAIRDDTHALTACDKCAAGSHWRLSCTAPLCCAALRCAAQRCAALRCAA
jgi:hypothetical protein